LSAPYNFIERIDVHDALGVAQRHFLVESIKARNRFYRAMLSSLLWLRRQQQRVIWVVLALVWVVPWLLRGVAAPLAFLFTAFAFLAWIIGPLYNVLLFFHPLGRRALGSREKIGAAVVTDGSRSRSGRSSSGRWPRSPPSPSPGSCCSCSSSRCPPCSRSSTRGGDCS
jgi:hypothetical protein